MYLTGFINAALEEDDPDEMSKDEISIIYALMLADYILKSLPKDYMVFVGSTHEQCLAIMKEMHKEYKNRKEDK